eukprot:3112409-Ditylum_brightwellii.AAC.1
MIPALMSLHLQCLGLPESAAKCGVSINKSIKHFVRTNTRESTDSYHHSVDYFKCCEDKGKTSSPCNWLFTNLTLLDSLEKKCNGLYLTSADGKFVSKRVAEGYVDNTDATTADQRTQNIDTPQSIAARMTIIA